MDYLKSSAKYILHHSEHMTRNVYCIEVNPKFGNNNLLRSVITEKVDCKKEMHHLSRYSSVFPVSQFGDINDALMYMKGSALSA